MGRKRFCDVIFWICVVCHMTCHVCHGDGDGQGEEEDDELQGSYEGGIDVHIGRERKASRDSRRKIIVTCVLEEPYMMLKPASMGSFIIGNDRFDGYMADVMMNLSRAIGFDYEIKLALDNKYDGMIGELVTGDAHIAVGPITVTSEREEVVDFTDPFMTFRSTAIVRKPRKRRKRQRLETAEDLLQSDVIYGVLDNSITQYVLRTAEEPLLRGMWARMNNFWPTPSVHSMEEGIERARRESYAFIVDTPQGEYHAGKEPCDLYTIEPFLSTRQYAIALRKNDGLRDVINAQLRVMHERQILSEFYLKWWRSTCGLYIPQKKSPRKNHSSTPKPTGASRQLERKALFGSRAAGCHSNMSLITLALLVTSGLFNTLKTKILCDLDT